MYPTPVERYQLPKTQRGPETLPQVLVSVTGYCARENNRYMDPKSQAAPRRHAAAISLILDMRSRRAEERPRERLHHACEGRSRCTR